MILRPNKKCEHGWFGAGGWNISYPNYRPYYKDDDTMKSMIAEHNDKIIDFCSRQNIKIERLTADYLERTFNWTIDHIENETEKEWVHKHLLHTEGTEDVSIAIWNIDKLKGKFNAD
jgi:hypothetical protein